MVRWCKQCSEQIYSSMSSPVATQAGDLLSSRVFAILLSPPVRRANSASYRQRDGKSATARDARLSVKIIRCSSKPLGESSRFQAQMLPLAYAASCCKRNSDTVKNSGASIWDCLKGFNLPSFYATAYARHAQTRPVVTDVAWSACLSVCCTRPCKR